MDWKTLSSSDFKLNEYELINYKDLRNAMANDYWDFYKWLNIVCKTVSAHWVDPEKLDEYLNI